MTQPKVALITGASRGIGLEIVRKLARAGWKTAACSSSEKIHESGADFTLRCDVTQPEQVRDCVERTLEKWGRIDALVNNAGLAGTNPLDPEDSDELWHRIIATNLHGTYYFSKHVLPHLPDRTGRIVNIASVLGLKGAADQTAYTAAKHGVVGFTRALAKHAASRKITVNAICPGWTRTEMARKRIASLGTTEQDVDRSLPLGAMVEPAEVADLVLMLLQSEAGAKITGQTLVIDAGTSA